MECAIASADVLKLKEDGIYFNSASCRELGKRYFRKYTEVIKSF